MKKIYTLAFSALMAGSVFAQQVVTLDMGNPVIPQSIEFNEIGAWTGAYGETTPWLQFGDFKLSHLLGGASYGGSYWDGFSPAVGGDTTDYGIDAEGNIIGSSMWTTYQWGCMAGGGIKMEDGEVAVDQDGNVLADAEAPYFVANWGYYGYGDQTNQVTYADQVFEPVGVYVCNAPWTYYGCVHGDGYARAFVEGDHIDLNAVGVAEDGSESTASFRLVEVVDGELKAANAWTWFDLSSLGAVKSVYFTVSSTDANQYGNVSANYFCMDKLQVKTVEGSSLERVDADRQVASVRYVNLSGAVSDVPFDGVNVVLTTYDDGTVDAVKVVK